MFTHARAIIYLFAAGVIWFAEDAVFSRGLGFDLAQTAIVTVYFIALFALAVWFLLAMYRKQQAGEIRAGDLPVARILSMAPVLTLIVGSFAALPVFILVLIAGSIL